MSSSVSTSRQGLSIPLLRNRREPSVNIAFDEGINSSPAVRMIGRAGMSACAGALRSHPRLFKTFAGTVEVRRVPRKARAVVRDAQAWIMAREGGDRATAVVGASGQHVSCSEETIGPGACRIFRLRALIPADRFVVAAVLEFGCG